MGQIKNIKLHIVTDIKQIVNRTKSNKKTTAMNNFSKTLLSTASRAVRMTSPRIVTSQILPGGATGGARRLMSTEEEREPTFLEFVAGQTWFGGMRDFYLRQSGYRQLGLRKDDILAEEKNYVKPAISRLPEDEMNGRIFRLQRAADLSAKAQILPADQWTTEEKMLNTYNPLLTKFWKKTMALQTGSDHPLTPIMTKNTP